MHGKTLLRLSDAASGLMRLVAKQSARVSSGTAKRQVRGARGGRVRAAPDSSRQSGTGVVRIWLRRQPSALTTFALSAGRFSPPWSAPSKKAEGVHKGSPWLQLLDNRDPPAAQQHQPPGDVKPQPDPATGLYEWSPAVVGHLDRFWRGERGVQEVTQRRRHVAHAELDPKQRDLDYVRERMGHWDAVVSDFQGVDVNRVVRNGIDIMEREPDAWRAKILILAAAYPGVDWSQFFTEYPSLCYVPNATLARAVNDWADQLIGAAPCSLTFEAL